MENGESQFSFWLGDSKDDRSRPNVGYYHKRFFNEANAQVSLFVSLAGDTSVVVEYNVEGETFNFTFSKETALQTAEGIRKVLGK